MGKAKIAITLDEKALKRLDRLVESRVHASRSEAIQQAVAERLAKLDRTRLAHECAKLNRAEEQAIAEEGFAGEAEWPEY